MNKTNTTANESNNLQKKCVEILDSHKAGDIEVYNVAETSGLADYYIICTANSTPHLKALAAYLHKDVKDEFGILPKSSEGKPDSAWIIIDYIDVIVHIFDSEKREFYNLEKLWEEGVKISE